MKRLFILFFIQCIIISVFAQNFIVDGITYKINPNQKDVTVVKGSEPYAGNIVIPSTVANDDKTYTVTHIGYEAFKNSEITSISLPEGLIEIGVRAFSECQDLKQIVIPLSVVNIESEAFIFCFSLSKLTFKSKTRPTIGERAFGKTEVKMSGISTAIPSNMAVPNNKHLQVDQKRRNVVY